MIDRSKILEVLEGYDLRGPMIGVVASHSALDTCDGAWRRDSEPRSMPEGEGEDLRQVLQDDEGERQGRERRRRRGPDPQQVF